MKVETKAVDAKRPYVLITITTANDFSAISTYFEREKANTFVFRAYSAHEGATAIDQFKRVYNNTFPAIEVSVAEGMKNEIDNYVEKEFFSDLS